MNCYKREDIVDAKFSFLDSSTGEPINVTSPSYRIVHYEGVTEVEDESGTPLAVSGRTGEYLVRYQIPTTAIENETYFIYVSGTHPIDGTTTLLEEYFRVVPESYFTGSNGGLVIQFTKP